MARLGAVLLHGEPWGFCWVCPGCACLHWAAGAPRAGREVRGSSGTRCRGRLELEPARTNGHPPGALLPTAVRFAPDAAHELRGELAPLPDVEALAQPLEWARVSG